MRKSWTCLQLVLRVCQRLALHRQLLLRRGQVALAGGELAAAALQRLPGRRLRLPHVTQLRAQATWATVRRQATHPYIMTAVHVGMPHQRAKGLF